jgi:hypothetical protein
MAFVKTRGTPTGAQERYRNLDRVSMLVANQESDTKWYAKALSEEGDFYFLAAAGYATEAACQSAIKTALSITI